MKPKDECPSKPEALVPNALGTSVWLKDQGWQLGQVLEEDIAKLMKQLGEARSELRDKEETHQKKQRGLLEELVEVSDAFERVFGRIEKHKAECTREVEAWVGSLRMVYKLLWRALKAQGVVRIGNLDGVYDPHWHLPATRIFDLAHPEGTIVSEEKPGYVWLGILLRKAEVAVVTHSQDDLSAETDSNKSAVT